MIDKIKLFEEFLEFLQKKEVIDEQEVKSNWYDEFSEVLGKPESIEKDGTICYAKQTDKERLEIKVKQKGDCFSLFITVISHDFKSGVNFEGSLNKQDIINLIKEYLPNE